MESKVKLFGHPVHPMLIVFPAGLFSTAVIFDIPQSGSNHCFLLYDYRWRSWRTAGGNLWVHRLVGPAKQLTRQEYWSLAWSWQFCDRRAVCSELAATARQCEFCAWWLRYGLVIRRHCSRINYPVDWWRTCVPAWRCSGSGREC